MKPTSSDDATQSASYFTGASNLLFTGNPNFNAVNGDVHVLQDSVTSDPIRTLVNYSASDALVYSKERCDPPRCAPATRDRIHQEIIDWVNNPDLSAAIYWLFGSAGAGKSAICHTIAEMFDGKGLLLGNFFFSRSAGSAGRSNGDRLFPTLIYQLLSMLPETRSYIKRAIQRNPLIFQASRSVQMSALFIAPLCRFSFRRFFRNLTGKQILLVVIDGLDECQDAEVQCDILRIIAKSTEALPIPIRFLIASRPEAHLKQTFHHDPAFKGIHLSSMNLDHDQAARQSISHFLHTEFRKIHETHPMRQHLDPLWPSNSVIEQLVSKSSPQFIFASTAVNYINDPEDHPDKRLNEILANSTIDDVEDPQRPFENLDKLYSFIFASVKPKYRQAVWCLLGIVHLAGREELCVPTPSPQFFDQLFNVRAGTVDLMLRSLASVVAVPPHQSYPIRSLHASLFDFLLEPQRSGNLVLDLRPSYFAIFKYNLTSILEIPGLLNAPWNFDPPALDQPWITTDNAYDAQKLAGIASCMSSLENIGDRETWDLTVKFLTTLETALNNLAAVQICSDIRALDKRVRAIDVTYSLIARSAWKDRTHAMLLEDRHLFHQLEDTRNPLTKGSRNPFHSTSVRIKHFIYTKFLAALLQVLEQNEQPGVGSPKNIMNYCVVGTTANPWTQTGEFDGVNARIALHLISAMISLQELVPDISNLIWHQRATIYSHGLKLQKRTHTSQSDLVSGCRKLILEHFQTPGTRIDAEFDILEAWSKVPVKEVGLLDAPQPRPPSHSPRNPQHRHGISIDQPFAQDFSE